ncbi:unnamed protein product, partial [Prorocentrum cordatum]
VDETASFRPAAACQRPAKGTQVSAGAPKYSLVTTLAAVALGVALADRVLLVWLPELLHGWLHEWLPDKPGDRWLQQEETELPERHVKALDATRCPSPSQVLRMGPGPHVLVPK